MSQKSWEALVPAFILEASEGLRALGRSPDGGEPIKAQIARAVRRAGFSYWRAFDLWYRKARRVTLTIGRDFDLLDTRPKRQKKPELPADNAAKSGGSYRQIKDGLAADEGWVSGRICRGRNLTLTDKNLIPSRETGFQDKARGEQTPARRPPPADPYGDDAFGPLPPDLGLDSDDWDEALDAEEFVR